MTTTTVTQSTLSAAEVDFFHDNGYAGPFTLCDEGAMARLRPVVERDVLTDDEQVLARHIDSGPIWSLCSHPAVVNRIASLLGRDLLVWSSAIFTKPPGAKGIPWHQDIAYWHLEPGVTVSAWMAIDPARVENSCVRVIPGSHRAILPKVKVDGWAFKRMADPTLFDESTAVPMELAPGQFFIFNERLLHGSAPNTSGERRLGLSVRYTVPFVKVNYDRFNMYHGREDLQRVVMVSGEDTMNFNAKAQPPPADGQPWSLV